jgi:hypothetical protein
MRCMRASWDRSNPSGYGSKGHTSVEKKLAPVIITNSSADNTAPPRYVTPGHKAVRPLIKPQNELTGQERVNQSRHIRNHTYIYQN